MSQILVVDDDDTSRTLITRILAKAGFEVLAAASGRAACKMVGSADQAVDIVVTDIFMPDMDGLEMMRAARAARPALDVIAVSGGSARIDVDVLGMARKLGAEAVLPKPVDSAALVRAVTELRARRAALGPAAGADI
jgi:CheY-like chemotaxis protein